jgi:large subunit ribosomal protein L20
MSYSAFIGALKKNDIALDRRVLAELACFDAPGFKAVVDSVK